jgi:hypothetical protein
MILERKGVSLLIRVEQEWKVVRDCGSHGGVRSKYTAYHPRRS